MPNRRQFVQRQACAWLGAAAWLTVPSARAQAPVRAVVSVPGPGNLLFLPLELARATGADEAEGIRLDIRHVGGGPQAFRELVERNSDFAAGGLPAMALQRATGQPLACIAPLTQVPAYTLLMREGLQGQVRGIADLAGRVVGVKGHTPGGRSTTQLFTEHVLQRAGLGPGQVNYVAVGQSFDSQSAALLSGAVDAIMGDEPFATRLVARRAAYVLADFHDLEQTRRQMGGLFLNGALATRDDVIQQRPEVVERVVKTVARTLRWIAQRSPADIVQALAPTDAEARSSLLAVLGRHKGIYAPDARFSQEQVATTERFFRATEPTPAAQALAFDRLISARWAGTRA